MGKRYELSLGAPPSLTMAFEEKCLDNRAQQEIHMSLIKSALIGAALTLAIASGASAQSNNVDVGDGIAMVITADGKMVPLSTQVGKKGTGKINAKGHAMLMQHATKLKAGTIIYRSGTSYYMLENKKIDADMALDHAKGWYDFN